MPVRIGIIGMGGFAAAHHRAIELLEARGVARLVCTCDPQPLAFAAQQQAWHFPSRRVRVFADYREMLAACHRDLDVLVVPTPIPLHAEMHRAGIEHGLAVYLEKPPTLDFLELERMIACDGAARHATVVGFNFIIEPERQTLKQRLLAGEFGPISEARLAAQWARPTSYFSRNSWAGRLLADDGRVVLDSCCGNAMAHFVHNLLFWAGAPEPMSWAQLDQVQAELYRAHDIQGADTLFVEAQATGGALLRLALSHACAGPSYQTEDIICERARIHYVVGKISEIRWNDGRIERQPLAPFDTLMENHLHYFRYLRREIPRPATTLADSRPFVILNDLAYVSSGHIAQIPPALLSEVRNQQEQKDYLHVSGLADAQDAFLERGQWPGANGWGRPNQPPR